MKRMKRKTMEDGAVLYYCDPEKNVKCRKYGCAHCLTITEGGVCFVTMKRECARTDANGNPVIYVLEKDKDENTVEKIKQIEKDLLEARRILFE